MTTNVVAYYGKIALSSGTLQAPADWSGLFATDGFSYQFRAVDLTSTQNVAVLVDGPTASGSRPGIGVLSNAPKSGEACDLVVIGETKIMAGAAISTIGTLLEVDQYGRFIPATSTYVAVAVAMMPANAAGDIITGLVNFLQWSSN